MGALQLIISTAAHNWAVTIVILAILYPLCIITYRISPFHPLFGLPGPILNRITYAPLAWHSYLGDEARYIRDLHHRHGTAVRIAPDAVDFNEVAALKSIYLEKGGFPKSRHYTNFDIDGHASIFSTQDVTERGKRAKVILPLFSISNVKAGFAPFEESLDRFITRFKEEKHNKAKVNVLDLARGMAIDAVTEYLFGMQYSAATALVDHDDGSKSANGGKMSASDVVDNFIATSRFLYLTPGRIYDLADRLDAWLYPNPGTVTSTEIVDDYGDRVVSAAARGKTPSTSYPARLLRAGFSPEEVRAQCKDIIFAGTDTIGMNVATLCFHLAKEPAVYDRLHREVMDAAAVVSEGGEEGAEHQQLPYLENVLKETLRMSLTNSSILPRQVDRSRGQTSWSYGGRQYPLGTVVSCNILEMHMSEEIWGKDPDRFRPERWEEEEEEKEKGGGTFSRSTSTHTIEDRKWCQMAFGLGTRQCIAKGMSMMELRRVTRRLVIEDVLRGAETVGERINMLEGFSSKVVGGKVDLVWRS